MIADVHLGYEWARGAAGDCVPAHSLAETLAKLDCLLARSPIERLVVAGDLVESSDPAAGPWRTWRGSSGGFASAACDWWCSRAITIEASLRAWPGPRPGEGGGLVMESQLEIAGWTIAHGHRPTRAATADLGPSPSRCSGSPATPPLLPGGSGQDHPACVLGQRRGTRRGHRAPARSLRLACPALPCQHRHRPARLRPASRLSRRG